MAHRQSVRQYDARRFAVALVHVGPNSPQRSLPGHVHCSADELRRRDFHSLRILLYPRYLSLHHHTEIDSLVDVLILCELGVLGHLVDRWSKGLSLHQDRHNGNLVEVRRLRNLDMLGLLVERWALAYRRSVRARAPRCAPGALP